MISIIIPTYQAEKYLNRLLARLKEQSLKEYELIVVDSSSTDKTAEIAKRHGARLLTVPKESFDHGGTRTYAGKESKGDIIVYLTQDVLPFHPDTLDNIIKPLINDSSAGGKALGAVYGRQIPYPDATPFAAHSRYFIYGTHSFERVYEDKTKYQIKTAFLSNAFTAYSRKALEEIGWFKENLISTEDTYAGAKMLKAGYRLAYVAEAAVYHSHNYSFIQEFKRYFDIGAFHKKEEWIVKEFGKANDEGFKYVRSELQYLLKNKKSGLIPAFFIRNGMKFLGYRLGALHKSLPYWLILMLSMHRGWWVKNKKKKKA